MGTKVNKPILVVGISISFVLWLWDSFNQQIINLGEWGLLGAIALGSGFWWWQGQTKVHRYPSPVVRLTEQSVQDVLTQVDLAIETLGTEGQNLDISGFKQQLSQLSLGFDRQELTIALAGGNKVGKTTLKEVLLNQTLSDKITLLETESLFKTTEIPEIQADLIVLLITGDLTNSHWEFLQKCHQNYQRFIIAFNKQDQYIPEERSIILEQVRQRLQPMASPSDIIAVSAAPQVLKVRKYEETGIVKEWTEPQSPEIKQLSDRLKVLLEEDSKMLVLGSIWREAMSLKQQAKEQLNSIRRDRALPLIEQYQWIAAATAFANPVAALDLLATAAISSQMVLDLGEIYQQKLSLSQGQAISGNIGKLMVKLGLVELSTQTIGSLLKSNAVTYVAGGTIQGVSAAYLTRLAGLSLVEYFQDQDINSSRQEGIDLTQIHQKIKQVFEQNKRSALVQRFIHQALPHLPQSHGNTSTV